MRLGACRGRGRAGRGVASVGLPALRARALGSGLQLVPLWAVEVLGDLWDRAGLTLLGEIVLNR